METCPHCNAKIKSSMLGTSVTLYSERAVKLINEFVDTPQLGYCTKCGEDLYANALSLASKEIGDLNHSIKNLIQNIPVITLPAPEGWEYSVIRMVTGQATMGTGAFMEISSSFTDLMGGQSKSYDEKIKAGESNCMMQLRLQALNAGGNAVIGTDIDYSEIGGAKSMIMVCMAGTAIKLKNMNKISESFETEMKKFDEQKMRINILKQLTKEN